MLGPNNINDDMKVLFLNSGYLTEDECCGYDEIAFVVRKEWLFSWYKTVADHAVTEEDFESWLHDEYTSDDSSLVYADAIREGELVLEKRIWNNRAHFYEVGEELQDGIELESKVFIRTMCLDSAKKVFQREKKAVLEDKDFFIDADKCAENSEDFENGEARLQYYDVDNQRSYGLYLTEIEVETEERKNA